ncbi:MAG: aldo/keto reductase, partial [Pseudomonadota bacterium]
MRYRTLGRTDLKVSALCLGTMTFGGQNSEAEGHAQLDRAVAAGVNFVDTAEMYAVPARSDTCGNTESITGRWFQKRGNRGDVILATKVIGKGDWLPHIRGGRSRLDRKNIQAALEG